MVEILLESFGLASEGKDQKLVENGRARRVRKRRRRVMERGRERYICIGCVGKRVREMSQEVSEKRTERWGCENSGEGLMTSEDLLAYPNGHYTCSKA